MTRLPALGRRGEGWFALQLLLLGAIVGAGLLSGGDWRGSLRVASDIAGAGGIVAGIAIVGLGVRDLGVSLSPLPAPPAGATLVERGIYSRVRHPIYAGLVLGALGFALATAGVEALGLTAGLAVLLDLKARREEVWLSERFAGYAAYARRTKRFVPGVY